MGATGLAAWLAEAYREAGKTEEGLAALAEALALIEKTDERLAEAEAHRIEGELLRAQGDQAGAEASFHTAIDIARNQGAKSWELRATVSLCRQWQEQGKIQPARAMLAEVYNWFSEGFDTVDLKEAKALLDELPS